LLINIVLGYWVYDVTHHSDVNVLRKLEQSKGREEILREQDSLLTIKLNAARLENNYKDSLLKLKPQEIIIIKDHFYEKADVVMSLSYDSSLLYLSDRLQGVKID